MSVFQDQIQVSTGNIYSSSPMMQSIFHHPNAMSSKLWHPSSSHLTLLLIPCFFKRPKQSRSTKTRWIHLSTRCDIYDGFSLHYLNISRRAVICIGGLLETVKHTRDIFDVVNPMRTSVSLLRVFNDYRFACQVEFPAREKLGITFRQRNEWAVVRVVPAGSDIVMGSLLAAVNGKSVLLTKFDNAIQSAANALISGTLSTLRSCCRTGWRER